MKNKFFIGVVALWLVLLSTCLYFLYKGIRIICIMELGRISILLGFIICALCYAGIMMCIDELKSANIKRKESNKLISPNESKNQKGDDAGHKVPAHFYDDIDRWFLD